MGIPGKKDGKRDVPKRKCYSLVSGLRGSRCVLTNADECSCYHVTSQEHIEQPIFHICLKNTKFDFKLFISMAQLGPRLLLYI